MPFSILNVIYLTVWSSPEVSSDVLDASLKMELLNCGVDMPWTVNKQVFRRGLP